MGMRHPVFITVAFANDYLLEIAEARCSQQVNASDQFSGSRGSVDAR